MTLKEAGTMGRNTEPLNSSRKKLLDTLCIEKIYTLDQQHTSVVYDTSEITGAGFYTGDGIITSGKNVLAVTVADCLPVFLLDTVKLVYSVVHSGWKGTGIAVSALKKMSDMYNSRPSDIDVIIGPSISACCYRVDKNRAEIFAEKWGKDSVVEKNSGYYLDLKKANYTELKKAGAGNINIIESCTACSNDYFSYRRQGANDFGLMLALIGYFL